MKIIQYFHTTDSGHRKYVMALAEALSRVQDVVVLTAKNAPKSASVRQLAVLEGPDPAKLGFARIVDRLACYWRQPGEFEAAAKMEIESPGSDVCHFQQLPSVLPSRILARAAKLGYLTVITIHNVSPHETSGFFTRRRQLGAIRAWRHADLLLLHSASLIDELVETAKVPRSKIAVVRHPIWDADSDTAAEHLDGYLFFGHLREGKGLPLFIQALALLDNPKASIVGSGTAAMVEEVRRRLKDLHLSNCTFDPRFVADDQVPAIFAQHRVLVAPYTHFAAQSGVTHLAATYGLATVVTAVGALPDLVHDYGVGEVADPEAASVADAMSKAHAKARAGDYELGLAQARGDLSCDAIAENLVKLYEGCSKVERRNA
jgi:glycosyltransferase involved in cell wall biosynthesis